MKGEPGYRKTHTLVGFFVLAAVAIVAVGTVQLGVAHRWFQVEEKFVVELPDEGTFGLREGGEVQMLGTNVGQVDRITIDDNGDIRADISVREEFARFIGTDSSVIVKRKFSVAGDAYLEISKGSPGRELEPGSTLRATADRITSDAVQRLMDELRERALPMIDDVQTAVRKWTEVGNQLNEAIPDIRQTLANLRDTTGLVSSGTGTVSRLIRDDDIYLEAESAMADLRDAVSQANGLMADAKDSVESARVVMERIEAESDNLPGSMKELREIMGKLDRILADMETTTDNLPEMTDSLKGSLDSVPALILQTQKFIRELEVLVEGLQQHWLIRGSVEKVDRNTAQQPSEAMTE